MAMSPETDPDLIILEQIEQNPDANQAALAVELDVAVGTVNWHIKRLVDKGYVKVKRLNRKKLRYIITPEGIAMRTRMTIDFIQNQFHLFRLVRQRVIEAISVLKSKGIDEVRIVGNGDVADVCRLTCMEQGVHVVSDANKPKLVIKDLKILVEMEGDTRI
jgi:predicted transcriptional regulator